MSAKERQRICIHDTICHRCINQTGEGTLTRHGRSARYVSEIAVEHPVHAHVACRDAAVVMQRASARWLYALSGYVRVTRLVTRAYHRVESWHCQPPNLITVRAEKANRSTCAAAIGTANAATCRALVLLRIHETDTTRRRCG